MKPDKYRPEIDGLRTLAVLPVIAFHAGLTMMSGGFVGVDIFFVISGFLIINIIASELAHGSFSIVGFYERRARRLLPALYTVLLATGFLAGFLLLPFEMKDLAKGAAATIFFVSNIFFWQQDGYFTPNSEQNPLIHTWSLSIEEQFYLITPIAMLVIWKWRPKYLLPMLVIAATTSLLIAHWAAFRSPSANFYLLPTRAWELLAGGIAALVFLNRARPTGLLADIAAVLGFIAIFWSLLTFDEATLHPSIWTLIPVLGTVTLLICSHSDRGIGQLLSSPPLVYIGLISYSAYLWHQPLFAFARLSNETPSLWLMVTLSGLSLLLAYLTWRFVEQPFRIKTRISRRGIFAYSVIGSITLLLMSGFLFATNGLPERFSPIIRPWVTYGPSDYAEHLTKRHTEQALNAPLSADKPNLLLIGDSFSQDFYNIMLKGNWFPDHNVSAIVVPASCQIHYGLPRKVTDAHIAPGDLRQCQQAKLSARSVAKIQQADIVIFAAFWKAWAAEHFMESLKAMQLPDDQRIIVVGSKGVDFNLRELPELDMSDTHLLQAPKLPSVHSTSNIFTRTLKNDNFINVSEFTCTNDCPLFTPKGELIYYDGKHLTPAGVDYFAGQLTPDILRRVRNRHH